MLRYGRDGGNGKVPRIKLGRLIVSVLLLSSSVGCASYYGHPEFTHSAMAQIEVGMGEPDFVALFGQPDERQVMTCGGELHEPWQCLIYHYNFRDSFDRNSFFFNLESEPPSLNHFSIEKIY
jgi:hypothetical protein